MLIASAKGAIELRNPLSEDHVALRPSLIARSARMSSRATCAPARNEHRLFELGRVFFAPDGEEERQLGVCSLREGTATTRIGALHETAVSISSI